MASTRSVGYGMVGAATTMVARKMTRRAMHSPRGTPRLPRAARRNRSFVMMVALAAAAGALLAIGDILQEQRKHVTAQAA